MGKKRRIVRKEMRLMIRNMMSERCKQLVRKELTLFGLHYVAVEMGEVIIEEDISIQQQLQLNLVLKRSGLELIFDRKTILVEKIRSIVHEMIESDSPLTIKFSAYLSSRLHYDYHYLSNLFVIKEGVSLEKYIMQCKIEKAKRILKEEDRSLAEIADRLFYSSPAHLNNQFKKIVGCTPGEYRRREQHVKD